MDPHELSLLLGSWGYPALLALFLLTGVGSPIPEDLLLLVAGYLTFAGVLDWPLTFIVSWCGVVGSDVMLYAAGRHLAWHSSRWPNARFLSPRRLRWTTRWFERFGHVLILIARLTPGTRAVVFVTAGVRDVPVKTFIGYDALGAFLWVPAMLCVGRALGHRIGDMSALLAWLNHGVTWALVFTALLLLIWMAAGREESKL